MKRLIAQKINAAVIFAALFLRTVALRAWAAHANPRAHAPDC
jgi:hypothetical protein